jgi:hypothetical protein
MNQKEYLKKYGIPSIESPEKRYNELKEQFLEMSQTKSDFDIEKFTVKKEGHFIAHNFHFLMRQYSLALSELRRMNIDRKEKLREIEWLKKEGNESIFIEEKRTYADLEVERLENEIDMLDLNMTNKLIMCDRFEKARKKIIKLNGDKAPTNIEYQKEEPEYWKWFLERKAIWQNQERMSGISEGVWENIDHLEQPALINPAFQIQVKDYSDSKKLGQIELGDIAKKIEDQKKIRLLK